MKRALLLVALFCSLSWTAALTGTAEAQLKSESCSKLNAHSRVQAERALVLYDQLQDNRHRLAMESGSANENLLDFYRGISGRIEKDLRSSSALAAEFSTIWRNLCKD